MPGESSAGLQKGSLDSGARPALAAHIGVVGLWSLAVGLVISGEYFGWSYGWATA
ncbi:MAG: hypothetical protein JWO70_3644, partial [Betaproteobacteria bacterium]|nr:hypothetical protein [Betaproteobacteria bacterium]